MLSSFVHTNARVRWRVAADDEATWARVGDFMLLNPVLVEDLPFQSQKHTDDPTVALTENGDVVFLTETIGLVPTDEAAAEDQPEVISRLGQKLLLWIRYLSFQHQIPSSPSVYAVTASTEINTDLPALPARDSTSRAGMGRAYLTECCATSFIVETAAEKVSSGEPVPVHHHLLLDAYAAREAGNFRQSILFATMAAESLAAARLEEEYEKSRGRVQDSTLRVIELDQAGGGTTRKDPVYEALASRTNFSSLIHERPLYLLNKSLLVDDQNAYRMAKRMYATRNKIVHRGELAEDDSSATLTLDATGAAQAISCAVTILDWFGDPVPSLPDDDMIPMSFVSWEQKPLH